jgi:Rad3-related DNA helicase
MLIWYKSLIFHSPPFLQVSNLVSRELEAESIVVFDEAHNIDNVCIEALSVTLDRKALEESAKSVNLLQKRVSDMKASDSQRLAKEVSRGRLNILKTRLSLFDLTIFDVATILSLQLLQSAGVSRLSTSCAVHLIYLYTICTFSMQT